MIKVLFIKKLINYFIILKNSSSILYKLNIVKQIKTDVSLYR